MLGMASRKVETNRDKRVADLLLQVLRAEKREDNDRYVLAHEIGWMANQQNITPDTLDTMSDQEITEFLQGMVGVVETSRDADEEAFAFDYEATHTPSGKRWGAIARKVARAFDR